MTMTIDKDQVSKAADILSDYEQIATDMHLEGTATVLSTNGELLDEGYLSVEQARDRLAEYQQRIEGLVGPVYDRATPSLGIVRAAVTQLTSLLMASNGGAS